MDAIPEGWYALALSDDLKPGQLLTTRLAERELVIWRNEQGVASVSPAWCPHMGAHFGHGGKVEGAELRCPFHGFRFDTGGTCTKAYGDGRTPKVHLDNPHFVERNGLLLAWHGSEAPAWEVPELELKGWTPLKARHWDLKSHPQETSENSVDIGHFVEVHGYSKVEVLDPLTTQGPLLKARYAMSRPSPFGAGEIRTAFAVELYGLGVSLVKIHVPQHDLHGRLYILSTPMGEGRVHLRAAYQQQIGPARGMGPLTLLPERWVSGLVAWMTLRGIAGDVSQDFEIWENKIYVDPPRLAEGDGPVGRYRAWAKQFYAQEVA